MAAAGRFPRDLGCRASGLYETAPVGGPDQDDYLNQVVEIRTALSPRRLLAAIGRIEAALGRERLVRWGPRSIDVDILWYDGSSVAEADLEVPHPANGGEALRPRAFGRVGPGSGAAERQHREEALGRSWIRQ